MKRIVNGEPSTPADEDECYVGDRVIRLPNCALELNKTPDGGWREVSLSSDNEPGPSSGMMGSGGTLSHVVKFKPWIAEQLWRRVIELEDELRGLRKAIHYKE